MSTRIITYHVCDGCHKDTLHDDIEIVQSKRKYQWRGSPTIDLCNECYERDRYICTRCKSVHEGNYCCLQ